jgi:hypothetical protein
MSVDCETNSNRACDSRMIGRSDFLFTAGAIAVIAGLLFPLSGHVLDVLLIFSVSLTAAVLIITLSAQGVLEASGFPLLILLTTMLRMALSVASARLILSQGQTGTIIGLVGNFIVRNNEIATTFVFGTLVVVIFVTICKAAKGISRSASDFTTDVVPIKQISIDSDLNAGVISNEQASAMRGKIAREVGFFVAMASAAKFILCGAVIELVTIITNTIGGMAIGVASSTATEMSAKIYMSLTAGAGVIIQASTLLTSVASRHLVHKNSLAPAPDDGLMERKTVRVEVVANEVASAQRLQYGSTTDNSESAEYLDSELAEIINPAVSNKIGADEKATAQDLDWFDEQTAGSNGKDDSNLQFYAEVKQANLLSSSADSFGDSDKQSVAHQGATPNTTKSDWGPSYGCDDYYEAIINLVESKPGDDAKTILMGAETVAELPVTMPVNIGIRLAQKNQKCLLIDIDAQRNAISKVFDIDTNKVRERAIVTCVNNLWVWPVNNFGKDNTINLRGVVAKLKSQYDRLIIYAPNIKLLADWDGIASCVEAAILFGSEDESGNSCINDFCELLIAGGCEVFEPAEVFAQAV